MSRSAEATKTQRSLILRHMPLLDSLRGIAVLLVLSFHGFGNYAWIPVLGDRWDVSRWKL